MQGRSQAPANEPGVSDRMRELQQRPGPLSRPSEPVNRGAAAAFLASDLMRGLLWPRLKQTDREFCLPELTTYKLPRNGVWAPLPHS